MMRKPISQLLYAKTLLHWSIRKITTLEARRFMQIPDGVQYPSKQFTEDMLKKQYLKLAKLYHPDGQGTSVSKLTYR